MHPTSTIETIPTTEITDDGPHLFWAREAEPTLLDSISEFGQLTPALAEETENGFELIAGHARLSACRKLGKDVSILVCHAADPVKKGLLYLADNGQREMTDGMRLDALRYFSPLMDESLLRRDVFPRLGIKPKSKDAKLFATWLTLPDSWCDLLRNGNIPLAAGAVLGRMSDEDRDAVAPLFSDFSWSRSNTVNGLNWLFETGKMTERSISDVMEAAGVNDLLGQGLSPKDAIARIVAAIKAARYPELSSLEAAFSTAAKEITAGTRWRMTQPNNFEIGSAELTILVKNAAQLESAIRDLEALSTLSPWNDIWNLGGQNND